MKASVTKIFLYITFYRLFTLLAVFLGTYFLTSNAQYLGGGVGLYTNSPYFWGWLNFDGAHFLSIAYFGYKNLQYFFFPGFPMLVREVATLLNGLYISYAISGLIVSHVAFFLALIGLSKLLLLDYKVEAVLKTFLLLFLFPTAFFFVSYYSESLFLASVVWSLYFARQKQWLIAGMLGAVATATRVIGIIVPVLLIVEGINFYEKSRKKQDMVWALISAAIASFGVMGYLYFLWTKTGDPFHFINNVGIYGEQRSGQMVLLPQVFYRYFFKIWPATNFSYFPWVFTLVLETVTAFVLLCSTILSFAKLRITYAIYLTLGFIIPSLSGSFSSLPRYAIVLFPMFIILALAAEKLPKQLQIAVGVILLAVQVIGIALFTRGYWVA